MARMYPNRIRVDTRSMAERTLYNAFRDGLPDDYVVFHHVAWLARGQRSGAQDGEADFVVVHPDLGILVVEVKGGRIRYDGRADQWFSNENAVKDPFEQAKEGKYSLLNKLKDLRFWRNRWITVGHAIAFPDVVVKGNLRLDAPESIVLDARDLTDVRLWIDTVLNYWRREDQQEGAPGAQGVEELIQLLSPSWELRIPLAVEFADEQQAIIRLTEEQYNLLDFLNFQRRVAISGCAGSGKTTLALEQARRLGRQGFRVLLTCFNRHLAEYLQSDQSLPQTADVFNFHAACVKMATRAGLQDGLKGGRNSREWYDHTLPELLIEATDILDPQYEAIIADEGQDFHAHWWIALQCLLKDPDKGILYIFYDDNQNLFDTTFELPEDLRRFALTYNCRNTQYIHRTFLPFYRSETRPEAKGPQGRQPELYYYDWPLDLKKRLRRILHHLIVQEDVLAEDVVILTPRARDKSLLWKWGYLGNLTLTDQWPPASNEIYSTSVHRFKGLESPVIILAELYPSDYQDLETLLYVGCSRARNHLIILAEEALPEAIRSRLPAA